MRRYQANAQNKKGPTSKHLSGPFLYRSLERQNKQKSGRSHNANDRLLKSN